MGVAEGWLGCLLAETGRPVDAERHLRRAIELVVRATSVGSDFHLFLVNALGRALAAQGRRSEAEAELERSRAFLLDRMQSPRELRHALEETAKVFDAWGRSAEAAACRVALKRLDDAIRFGMEVKGPPERIRAAG